MSERLINEACARSTLAKGPRPLPRRSRRPRQVSKGLWRGLEVWTTSWLTTTSLSVVVVVSSRAGILDDAPMAMRSR